MLTYFYKKQNEALYAISKQKKEIECNDGVCTHSLSIPSGVYNNWYSNMCKVTNIDKRESVQRKFSVLCSRLFENKEDYYLSHGSVKESIVRDKINHLYISYEQLDHKKVKQQYKDAFIIFRKHMQHNDKLRLVVDVSNVSMYLVAIYLLHTSYDDHILGYLLMETIEKPVHSVEIYTKSKLVKLFIRKIINLSSIKSQTEQFKIY